MSCDENRQVVEEPLALCWWFLWKIVEEDASSGTKRKKEKERNVFVDRASLSASQFCSRLKLSESFPIMLVKCLFPMLNSKICYVVSRLKAATFFLL